MSRALVVAMLVSLCAGCPNAHERETGGIVIGPGGTSDDVTFDVPEGAASITVVVQGADAPSFALASFVLSDGIEHVAGVDPFVLDEVLGYVGESPDRQHPTRGTFTFQYPTIASQALPPGPLTLRVASNVVGAHVTVRVVTPRVLGSTLHVSLVSFTSAMRLESEPEFVSRLQAIYASAGIDVVVDERVSLPARAAIPPPETEMLPGDHFAALVAEAHAALSTDALPIILVDIRDADGLSRGIPCPPDSDNYYHAVFVDPTLDWPDPPRAVGRLAAHELGHALGLPHVEEFTPPPAPDVFDPFDDTAGFDTTLMGSLLIGAPIADESLRITPQQAFAIRHSALLD